MASVSAADQSSRAVQSGVRQAAVGKPVAMSSNTSIMPETATADGARRPNSAPRAAKCSTEGLPDSAVSKEDVAASKSTQLETHAVTISVKRRRLLRKTRMLRTHEHEDVRNKDEDEVKVVKEVLPLKVTEAARPIRNVKEDCVLFKQATLQANEANTARRELEELQDRKEGRTLEFREQAEVIGKVKKHVEAFKKKQVRECESNRTVQSCSKTTLMKMWPWMRSLPARVWASSQDSLQRPAVRVSGNEVQGKSSSSCDDTPAAQTLRVSKSSGIPGIYWVTNRCAWELKYRDKEGKARKIHYPIAKYIWNCGSPEKAKQYTRKKIVAVQQDLIKRGMITETRSRPMGRIAGIGPCKQAERLGASSSVTWCNEQKLWKCQFVVKDIDGKKLEICEKFCPEDNSPEQMNNARVAADARLHEIVNEHKAKLASNSKAQDDVIHM
eukprot:TRINITY_DN26232_c0_g1_i1.p1 TRINITY_DN26232_c0_g1~~TRINITY_DN26232_c0_g1_i1.p1  ORF type:complete len:476 (-),score=89.76 TRINITY_DN26232_c0_g1_i1:211-1536(-)